jgi:hypothetical protein
VVDGESLQRSLEGRGGHGWLSYSEAFWSHVCLCSEGMLEIFSLVTMYE